MVTYTTWIKKLEIRNVDVSKQAFCGKGGYTTRLKYCEGGYSVGYRKKKETNFNTGYYFNQGRRVDSIQLTYWKIYILALNSAVTWCSSSALFFIKQTKPSSVDFSCTLYDYICVRSSACTVATFVHYLKIIVWYQSPFYLPLSHYP